MLLYRVFFLILPFFLRFPFLFPKRFHSFLEGRARWSRSDFEREASSLPLGSLRIWIHVPSLGELEQVRPLIVLLKKEHDVCIILSFTSPSGYEKGKNDPLLDFVFYLPPDIPKYDRLLFDLLKPEVLLFIRHELWYGLICEAKKRKVLCICAAAVFREGQIFFHALGGTFRKMLQGLDQIFVQDEKSRERLGGIGIEHVEVVGDTRVEKVWRTAEEPYQDQAMEYFSTSAPERPILILGSLGQKDWIHCAQILKEIPLYKYVIVPHDIDENFMTQIEHSLGDSVIRHSRVLNKENVWDKHFLLIDCVGILSRIYRYGDAAFIGGGFEGQVHNVLEPAVYGIPLMIGYHQVNRKKFIEVSALQERKGLLSIKTAEEFKKNLIKWAQDPQERKNLGQKNKTYVKTEQKGSSEKIMNYIIEKFPTVQK
ncbi:MAG: hypothetical protein OXB93_06550 [Cytophagales bacterium]|nr:hypothetical protein [Cytophagales bacterium]